MDCLLVKGMPGKVVGEGKRYASFVNNMRWIRSDSGNGITHDQLEYDEDLIEAVMKIQPKFEEKEISDPVEWNQIIELLKRHGLAAFKGQSTVGAWNHAGTFDTKVSSSLEPANMDEDATDWMYDGRFNKLAIIFLKCEWGEKSRFLVFFRIQPMSDYLFCHLRCLRNKLNVNSNTLALTSNKDLNNIAEKYYRKQYLNESDSDDLENIDFQNLATIELEVGNSDRVVAFELMKSLDSLVAGEDSNADKRNLLSDLAKEIGLSADVITSAVPKVVILVQT